MTGKSRLSADFAEGRRLLEFQSNVVRQEQTNGEPRMIRMGTDKEGFDSLSYPWHPVQSAVPLLLPSKVRTGFEDAHPFSTVRILENPDDSFEGAHPFPRCAPKTAHLRKGRKIVCQTGAWGHSRGSVTASVLSRRESLRNLRADESPARAIVVELSTDESA